MLAIGNGELKEPLGDTIVCPVCGQTHVVKYGDKILQDGTKVPSKLLAFYTCAGKYYLCGVDGFLFKPEKAIEHVNRSTDKGKTDTEALIDEAKGEGIIPLLSPYLKAVAFSHKKGYGYSWIGYSRGEIGFNYYPMRTNTRIKYFITLGGAKLNFKRRFKDKLEPIIRTN